MSLWDHVVAAIICIAAPLLVLNMRRLPEQEIQFEPEDKIKLYHNNAFFLIVLGLVVLTVWRIPNRSLTALGLSWPEWSSMAIILLLAIILLYLLDVGLQFGLRHRRKKWLEKRRQMYLLIPVNAKEWTHFLFLALAAGIGEEIIFRGFLIQYLIFWTGNNLSGIFVSGFFSSALFAFLHGYQGRSAMIKIFFFSLLFAGLFIYTKSLIPVMLVHMLIDAMTGWLGVYILRREGASPEMENEQEG